MPEVVAAAETELLVLAGQGVVVMAVMDLMLVKLLELLTQVVVAVAAVQGKELLVVLA